MAARHIVYVTNEIVVSLVARGGRLAGRKTFPMADTAKGDFESHLEALASVPTHVITDLAEEDFRVDTIPHLGARDQEAVLTRRLSQIFRNTPYKHAITQGRDHEGRRDDRVVYTAITNGELLRPWVEALEGHQVPVEGIHSSAVFSGRLLEELELVFPHTLLVTFTPGDALRQSYFRDKEIKFSRLTPLNLEDGENLGALLAGEVGRTWQYLDSLRYFGSADQLEVCVLVHAKDRPGIEPALRDYDQIKCRLLDIGQVAEKLGMKPPPDSSSAEEVLAHLFLRRRGENHYASSGLRRFALLRKARLAIGGAAGVVLLAGLAFGGWNLAFALQGRELDTITARRIQDANRELEQITRSTPSLGADGQTMRDTVAFYSRSLREYPTLLAVLAPVSSVLDGYPKIRLTQVAWQAVDDENALPVLAPMTPRDAPPLRAVTKAVAAAPPPAPGQSGEAPFSSGRHAVALLEGTVEVEGLDFRKALAQVQALAEEIGKIPGYRANVVDSPLDVTSRVAITAKLGEGDPGTTRARFSLRVSRATEMRS